MTPFLLFRVYMNVSKVTPPTMLAMNKKELILGSGLSITAVLFTLYLMSIIF